MKRLLSVLLCVVIALSLCFSAIAKEQSNVLIGDTDLDSNITIMDATYIQYHLAELRMLTPIQQKAADTDSSGTISIIDATLIQKFIANIITEFPQNPDFPPQSDDEKLLEIAEKISSVQSDSTLTFSTLSDVHFDEKDKRIDVKFGNIEKMGELQNLVNVDFVANMGDFVIGNEEKDTTVSSLTKLIEKLDLESNAPVLKVRGNHDDNGWYTYGKYGGSNKPDEIINDKEWHDIALSDMPDNYVFDKNNPYGGYGYIDHEASKIRVFVLNSSDIPYVLNDDGSYRYNSYTGHAFSDYQLDFVANALYFSDKENPNDWAALFLMHVPLDTSNFDNERFGDKDALIRGHEYMLSIINAYKNGTSFKASGNINNVSFPSDRAEDFPVSVDVDYSQKGCGEVIAFFSGHTHTNNYCDQVGIKNSLSYGYTFIGTVGSETFTNYVVDRDKKTISAFTYGKTVPEHNQGTLTKTPQSGSIESGEWSVTYNQFVPDGTNLLTGLSEKHDMYYTFCDESYNIDLNSMELDNSAKVAAARKLTKAIAVKPFTTYIIPDDFTGDCLSFNSTGIKRAYLKFTDHGDYKTFTTGIRNYFVLFSLDTSIYKDYENFYVKESAYGIDY